MPLQVFPAGDADMYRAAVIEHDAYKPLRANDILFPGPFPSDVLHIRAEELKEDARGSQTFCLKVIDTEIEDGDEQMIAFAKWVIHDASYRPNIRRPQGLPPWANAEACGLLFGELDGLKPRNIGSRDHVYLAKLQTLPKHQGRGAASMMLQVLIGTARVMNLPVYLESSEPAHGLYLKYGFQDLEELLTDLSPWGLTQPHRAWAMIKEPDVGT